MLKSKKSKLARKPSKSSESKQIVPLGIEKDINAGSSNADSEAGVEIEDNKVQNHSTLLNKDSEDNKSTLKNLYVEFPTLVVQDKEKSRWSMLVTISPIPCLLKISTPYFPSMVDTEITGDETVKFLVPKADLDSLVRVSNSLSTLLRRLQDRLGMISRTDAHGDVQDMKSMELVLVHLGEVGWDNVATISPSLNSAVLTTRDDRREVHQLSVDFSSGDQDMIISHELPPGYWEPNLSLPLSSLYQSWVEAVVSLGPAWDNLRELDRLCWVLDPDPPRPQHLYRRLVVSTSLSMHITIDPTCPTALPALKFLGADQRVEPLREALASNMELWEEENPLINNLESVLGFELPSRSGSTREEWSVECGICYSYTLEEELPSTTCDENRCGQPFHPSCLYDWLTSKPGVRSTMNTAYGECPYCSKPIRCSRPTQ